MASAARSAQHKVSAVALAVAMIVGLASCHQSGSSDPEIVDGVSIRQSELPITSLIDYSQAENRVLFEAYSALLQQCMARHGFDYPRDPWQGDTPDIDRRYGLTNLDQAQKWGYDLPPPPPLPSDDWFASLSKAQDKTVTVVLFGSDDEQVPVGSDGTEIAVGCVGEARDGITGSLRLSVTSEEMRLEVEKLEAESYTRSLADERVQQVIQRWAECMHASGFSSVNSPADAPELAAEEFDQAKDVAVAQVVCNDKVDLVETWSAVEAEYQQKSFDANEPLIRKLVELRAQAVENARSLASS